MFDFRCYTCRATLGRGLPPISALSKDQFEGGLGDIAEPLDRIDNQMHREPLKGTQFEGMGTGSFCEFCLIAITEFPSAMESKGRICSWDSITLNDSMMDMDAYKNRVMTLLEARDLYRTMEAQPMLALLDSLVKSGIKYRMINCWFPGCTELERILLPEDQSGCHLHSGFLSCFQTLSTERGKHEFIAFGHTNCECDSCEWIKWDNWDMDREEAETRAHDAEYNNLYGEEEGY